MRSKFLRREVLRKSVEFDRVFKRGKFFRYDLFTAILSGNGLEYNRVGYIVGKKLGNSVTRSRIKRIFREAYRQIRPRLIVGFDFVFLPKQKVKTLKRQDIEAALSAVFTKAGIINLCGSD